MRRGGNSTSITQAAGSISPTTRRIARSRPQSRHSPSKASAPEVSIGNVTVEKYASPAQRGAIHAREGARGRSRIASAVEQRAGISVGTGTRVRNCDIHHNGQIGIGGDGKDIRIERNRIWANNTHGFDPVGKLAASRSLTATASRSAAIMSMTTTVLACGVISNVVTSSTRTIS